MQIRKTSLGLLLVTMFVGGFASGHARDNDAMAQMPPAPSGTAPPPVASAIVVPKGGLAFRATDGTLIATLSRDARGGFLQVVNGDGVSTTRVPEDYRPGPGF
jgi:hypothetical protein